ncbi:MAG TPA: hypothetical protein VLG41_14715, partial [Hydrogenophaga sp.]|nr:hypothetical protein [Hydrogenophaga sp.]
MHERLNKFNQFSKGAYMMNSKDIVTDLNTNLPLQATNEGGHSNLPGKDGGPYDAYRHILWTAEMTRRYGENTARSMAAVHELEGDLDGQGSERRAMDEHNNEVGFSIGRTANSWDEVVKASREAIDASLERNGPATWLSEDQWRHSDENPNPAPTGPDKQPLPIDQWNWPVPQWPEGPYPLHPLVPAPPPGNSLRGLSFWALEGWDSVDPYGIDPMVNTAFNEARAVVPVRDPLAIDLDKDGIETIGITATPVLFDHDSDGTPTPTGWLHGDDAWLVLDRNGNGSIDTGAELFGTDTRKADGQLARSGFDALRDLDSDGNGLLNADDALFAQLQLWQDQNQDGLSQADELASLAHHGITAIDGFGLPTDVDLGNGNRVAATALVMRRDGTTTQAVDLILANEPPLPTLDVLEPIVAQAPEVPALLDPLPHDSTYAADW